MGSKCLPIFISNKIRKTSVFYQTLETDLALEALNSFNLSGSFIALN